MKNRKKTKPKKSVVLNDFHLVLTGYDGSDNQKSKVRDILKNQPDSVSLIGTGTDNFKNEKSVFEFESLNDTKLNEEFFNPDDLLVISDVNDFRIELLQNKNSDEIKKKDLCIDLNDKNQPIFIKYFLFKNIDWKNEISLIESIKIFFEKQFVEAKNYLCSIIDENKKSISVEKFLNISFFKKISLQTRSLINYNKTSTTLNLRRGNFIFKESVNLRPVFVLICLVMFFAFPIMSFDAGISGDEDKHVDQAKKVFAYFQTSGEDTSYMVSPYGPFYAYNITFDVMLHLLIEKLNIEDVYEFRHVINSYTGFFTVLFCGLLVVSVAGWQGGILALLLLFFSPRFLGHSFSNPKDIPFALGYVFTFYFMVRFIRNLPKISMTDAVFIALGIGFTLNIRIGGLLLIAMLFLFTGLHTITSFKITTLLSKHRKYIGKLILVLAGISLVGYIIGFIFWPYGLENPIKNPFESLKNMTNFKISLRQTFEGNVIWSDNVPWYYTGKYMLVTIPIVILAGLLIYFVTYFSLSKKYGWLKMFILLFGFLFPLIYIIYRESNVYGGWRHMNFSYILIVASVAIATNHLFFIFKLKYIQYSVLGLLFIGLLHPIIHTFKNHPYQYIYFNQLVGGVNGAYGNYEMDYYYHTLKEGSEWLIENKIDTTSNKKVTVASNHAEIVKYYFRDYEDHVNIRYVRFYDRGNFDWDYAVIANSYINPYQQKKKYWPPKNTIHQIKVNKAVVGAVIERKDKNDFLGYQTMRSGNTVKAIEHFKKAIAADPDNEAARLNLAKVYIDTGNLTEAMEIVNATLKIYENYDKALNLLGIIYLKRMEFNNALGVFNRIIQVNPKFVNAYYNIGVVFINQKKNEQALQYFQQAIKVNPKYKPSYLAVAHILKQAGREDEAKRYLDAANKLR